jgi:hypothetical protein
MKAGGKQRSAVGSTVPESRQPIARSSSFIPGAF